MLHKGHLLAPDIQIDTYIILNVFGLSVYLRLIELCYISTTLTWNSSQGNWTRLFFKHNLIVAITTMPAKSLGALAMIYAIVELQNPLPRETMLWKGDMNISASTSYTFLQR